MKLAKLSLGIMLSSAAYYAATHDKTHIYVWGNGTYQPIPG